MEMVVLPSMIATKCAKHTDTLTRGKREYQQDPTISIDGIGQPRGIPNEFKARNEIASGFESILPWIAINKHTEWINYLYYNQQRFINYTDNALTSIGEQLSASSRMTWQNQHALDWLLAEGGLCSLFGDYCCSYIPNNTSSNGSFAHAMTKLKNPRTEVKDNAGHGKDWFTWLEFNLGRWGATLAKIGMVTGVCIVIMAIIFCCGIPILLTVITNRMTMQMSLLKQPLKYQN